MYIKNTQFFLRKAIKTIIPFLKKNIVNNKNKKKIKYDIGDTVLFNNQFKDIISDKQKFLSLRKYYLTKNDFLFSIEEQSLKRVRVVLLEKKTKTLQQTRENYRFYKNKIFLN